MIYKKMIEGWEWLVRFYLRNFIAFLHVIVLPLLLQV